MSASFESGEIRSVLRLKTASWAAGWLPCKLPSPRSVAGVGVSGVRGWRGRYVCRERECVCVSERGGGEGRPRARPGRLERERERAMRRPPVMAPDNETRGVSRNVGSSRLFFSLPLPLSSSPSLSPSPPLPVRHRCVPLASPRSSPSPLLSVPCPVARRQHTTPPWASRAVTHHAQLWTASRRPMTQPWPCFSSSQPRPSHAPPECGKPTNPTNYLPFCVIGKLKLVLLT